MSEEGEAAGRRPTTMDRERQLADFARACDAVAEALTDAGDRLASDFRLLAAQARDLLESGFDQSRLTDLSGHFPDDPVWLNPKALDAGLPQEPWQRAVAEPIRRARQLALDLRTIADR